MYLLLVILIHMYVSVISRYKDDIIVITQGRAEVECNNNDIIRM